jgi:hypothetical protein
MRAIVNIISDRAFKAVGWRAKSIFIIENNQDSLIDVLKVVPILDGKNLFELITHNMKLKADWIIHVNGSVLTASSDLNMMIKDSAQIYIQDNLNASTSAS